MRHGLENEEVECSREQDGAIAHGQYLHAKGLPNGRAPLHPAPVVGRTWWAHFELTRINTTPTILRQKVEDLRETRASTSIAG